MSIVGSSYIRSVKMPCALDVCLPTGAQKVRGFPFPLRLNNLAIPILVDCNHANTRYVALKGTKTYAKKRKWGRIIDTLISGPTESS